jgi:hypothetical protein
MMKDAKENEAGALTPFRPSLFTKWSKKKLDGRRREAKWVKATAQGLLSVFPESPPPAAQLIAKQAAFKALALVKFECFVLSGGEASEKADETYLRLSNSLRADLETLSRMQKDGGPGDRVPSLQEYLDSLKKAGAPE